MLKCKIFCVTISLVLQCEFKKNYEIKITTNTFTHIEFVLIGINYLLYPNIN